MLLQLQYWNSILDQLPAPSSFKRSSVLRSPSSSSSSSKAPLSFFVLVSFTWSSSNNFDGAVDGTEVGSLILSGFMSSLFVTPGDGGNVGNCSKDSVTNAEGDRDGRILLKVDSKEGTFEGVTECSW